MGVGTYAWIRHQLSEIREGICRNTTLRMTSLNTKLTIDPIPGTNLVTVCVTLEDPGSKRVQVEALMTWPTTEAGQKQASRLVEDATERAVHLLKDEEANLDIVRFVLQKSLNGLDTGADTEKLELHGDPEAKYIIAEELSRMEPRKPQYDSRRSGQLKSVGVGLSPFAFAEIELVARRNGMSLSKTIRYMIEMFLAGDRPHRGTQEK